MRMREAVQPVVKRGAFGQYTLTSRQHTGDRNHGRHLVSEHAQSGQSREPLLLDWRPQDLIRCDPNVPAVISLNWPRKLGSHRYTGHSWGRH